MDILDKQIKIKRFFKTIFRDIDFSKEKIRVFQNNKDNTFNKVNYFYDIDELVSFSTNKSNYNLNTYFQLATLHTDAEDGKEDSLAYRYCLVLDFDKKDLGEDFNHKDIVNRFKELKIYCHAIVDSGNGYHAYIVLNKTADIEKVGKVQGALCERLGADRNAIKKTQILRIPYTYNVKDKAKTVRIVHLEDRNSKLFRAYDINFLYEKNCIVKADDTIKNDTTIKYTLNNTNVPKCINDILLNGSEEGNRYKDLQNIVVSLRQRNKDLSTIKEVCKEWAFKSNYYDSLEYRVENIYNNKISLELNCSDCQYYSDCYSKVVSDFYYNEDDLFITLNETNMSRLKKSNRKGAKVMKSNDLLVYCVLKNHSDGLTKDELLSELTYTKKKVIKNVAISERTLKDTLKSLEENGFVEVVKGNSRAGIPNLYKIKNQRTKVELTYNISYSATYECIKGNISSEELRLYNYIRYLHHKQQREDQKALKGNLFQFNQIDLAKGLGVTQGRISQMIENLLDEKLLSVWYRQQSKNNGFDYNIYRLNY